MAALSQCFALLMAEYNLSFEGGKISINEANRPLTVALAIQKALNDMKLHLEDDVS